MTRMPEAPDIQILAERIADAAPVDWEAETGRLPHLARQVERLRTVQKIADAQRILTARVVETDHAELEATASLSLPETLDPTGRTWGPLTIRAKLGQGSFGEVFRAYDPALDREVALKLIEAPQHPGSLDTKRFLAEARRLARVRHENVLVVHGAETHDGRPGIWTDLLRGRTLQQYLVQERTIGPREAALIGLDLCRALAAVHREGLVHRDIKPANVMREEGGRIILMDFGAGVDAKPRTEGALASTIEGTPLYMAPEQIRGEAVTPAVDIYALGVLLYHAVSGVYPIEAGRFDELVEKHRSGKAIPLRDRRPDLPAEFVQVIERALEPDPRRRFPSAGSLERALAGTLGPGAAHVEEAQGSRPAAVRSSRRGWILAAAGGVAGIIAVALLVRWPQRVVQPTPPPVPSSSDRTSRGVASLGPTTSSGPLIANAALYRGDGAARTRLQDGEHIAPGDALSLTIQGVDSMYVYVLDEDSKGHVFVLFPVPGLYPSNPLPPRVSHRLPGRFGPQSVNWEVTTAGGRENVLVLANRVPLIALEREILRFPHAVPGAPIQYGELGKGALGALRSIGGMAPSSDPSPAGPSHLSQILSKLGSTGPSVNRPWVYQIGLESSPAH